MMWRNMDFTNSPAGATESQIEIIEGYLGYRLPKQYRLFLLEHNGGKPNPNTCDTYSLDAQDEKINTGGVRYLFHADPDFKREVDYYLLDYIKTYEHRVPQELIPIGADVFGNCFCLAVAGPYEGATLFWEHEEETDPPSYYNIEFVAKDFNTFLSSLYKHS